MRFKKSLLIFSFTFSSLLLSSCAPLSDEPINENEEDENQDNDQEENNPSGDDQNPSEDEKDPSTEEEYTKTEYTDGLIFELNSAKDGYIVTDYLSIEDEIVLPELYNNLPVKEIGEECFEYDDITSIELPKSLRKIGRAAFSGVTGLVDITLPEGLEEIGDEAFYYISTLKSVTLPSTLKTIGNKVFGLADDFKEVNVSEDNEHFKDIHGVLYSKDETTLYVYPEGKADTTYDIPKTVKHISDYAFYGAMNLTSVTIPDNVETIGVRSFAALFNATQISLNPANSKLTKVGDKAFAENSLIKSFIFPKGVTELGSGVFDGDNSLTSVQFLGEITKIPDDFFNSCTGLQTINIPATVTEIGNGAFSGCNSLTILELPENLTKIGQEAFAGCSKLSSIIIPDKVNEIDDNAFSYCTALTKVTFPTNLTSIGRSAFSGTGITNLDLSNTLLESIGSTAFFNSKVSEVSFPSTLKRIEEKAFENTTIVNLELNEGLEFLGEWSFGSIGELKNVYLPSTLKTVEGYVFQYNQQAEGNKVNYYTPLESIPSTWDDHWIVEHDANIILSSSLDAYHEAINGSETL